ncbi:MAG: thymidylate synthase (FAD) [Verrucomicrobiales bacterium]|nr:thymidylate synthase (FAD) [Verrucomicrobiales bacterium]|tara:strand:+ start:1255 stop:1869 length:615 start_codon:yes stop_codon:yes gene_type:complete
MNVELIDKMGSDLSVVNAARVSFAKVKTELEDKDEKLIKYLAEHEHWSPFAHASLSFRIKAPVFVARQLVKHQVGLAWNEVSRRYVDSTPEFYIPFMWRKRPDESIKQGSSKEEVEYDITHLINVAQSMYKDMLEEDIAPEMARMILPQCMMTEWIWSGSVYAFARVCNLRNKEDAQSETRVVSHHISRHMKDHFPMCVKYLMD